MSREKQQTEVSSQIEKRGEREVRYFLTASPRGGGLFSLLSSLLNPLFSLGSLF